LGKLVAEINEQGVNMIGHVYAGPTEIAQTTGGATWVHTDPLIAGEHKPAESED
jgi:hypothetical protein